MKKAHRLSVRLTSLCLALAAIICAAICTTGYYRYRNSMYRVYNNFAYEIANTARSYVDGDALPGYLETGKTDAAYDEMDRQLLNLYRNCDLTSIYLSVPDAKDLTIANVYDVRIHTADNPAAFALGVVDPIGVRDPQEIIDIFSTGKQADDYFIRKTSFGYNTSAIIPVTGSGGRITALLTVDVPMPSILRTLHQYLLSTVLLTAFIVTAFNAFLVVYLRRRVVSPLRLIASETDEFTRSENALSQKLPTIRTGDEIEQLAGSVYQMEADINRYIANLTAVTAEKERIGAELDVAKHIQASMLPCIFPAFPGRPELDIYATMTPAKEVGGDFYDFFLVDDDHLAMVMADVSGKGVPAALFMVIAKTLIKNSALSGLDPKAVLEKVNSQLCESNDAEMFVTVWLGILNIRTGELTAANAGHEYPVVKKAGGSYELIHDRHGFVVGGLDGAKYQQYTLPLLPGDRLFLYTDGVAEATDSANQLYGTDRMLAALNALGEAAPQALLTGLKADIDVFVGEAPQFDDITMLCLDLRPVPSRLEERSFPVSLDRIGEVTAFVEGCFTGARVPARVVTQMNIAVDEIFSNIARYSGASSAQVACGLENGRAVLRFTDDGAPYDPTQQKDPDVTLSAEERDIGGLGVFMVKKFMDSMLYQRADGKNVLTLIKKPD